MTVRRQSWKCNPENNYPFWAEKPACAPYQPPTAIPSRHPPKPATSSVSVQIKFPAEVQFHIHKAAKPKQEKDRQYHWTLLNTSKLSAVCFGQKFENHWTLHFNVWIVETFLEEIYYMSRKSRNSTLLFRFSSIDVPLRFSLDKTTRRHWDFNCHSDIWWDVSIQSRTFSGVGELKASLDVVIFEALNLSFSFKLLSFSLIRLFLSNSRFQDAFAINPSFFQHCSKQFPFDKFLNFHFTFTKIELEPILKFWSIFNCLIGSRCSCRLGFFLVCLSFHSFYKKLIKKLFRKLSAASFSHFFDEFSFQLSFTK